MIHLDPMPILKLITGVGGWNIKLARVEPEAYPKALGGIIVRPSPSELQALGDEWSPQDDPSDDT